MFWNNFKADLAKAHRSATVWFNALAGMAVLYLPQMQEQFPQLQDYLPPNAYHYAMGAVVLGNVLLRFKTNCALREK